MHLPFEKDCASLPLSQWQKKACLITSHVPLFLQGASASQIDGSVTDKNLNYYV